jgi:hypothetical protein
MCFVIQPGRARGEGRSRRRRSFRAYSAEFQLLRRDPGRRFARPGLHTPRAFSARMPSPGSGNGVRVHPPPCARQAPPRARLQRAYAFAGKRERPCGCIPLRAHARHDPGRAFSTRMPSPRSGNGRAAASPSVRTPGTRPWARLQRAYAFAGKRERPCGCIPLCVRAFSARFPSLARWRPSCPRAQS